jgi:hypothetical protein
MTGSFKAEVIGATIDGMVFRKRVYVGERYLVACQDRADALAGLQPMVTAWQTEDQARSFDEEAGRLGFDVHGWAKAELTPDEAYPFPMWIVFEHPPDFPTCYAAKLFHITREGDTIPTQSPAEFITAPYLTELRERLMTQKGMTQRLGRHPDDLPGVIESWL